MATLNEIEEQALLLSPRERGELLHSLILSLEGTPESYSLLAEIAYQKKSSSRWWRTANIVTVSASSISNSATYPDWPNSITISRKKG